MKKKYEVSYYEYGLTRRMTKRFFFGLSALIYSAWVKMRYGYECYATVYKEYDGTEY